MAYNYHNNHCKDNKGICTEIFMYCTLKIDEVEKLLKHCCAQNKVEQIALETRRLLPCISKMLPAKTSNILFQIKGKWWV